MRSDFSLNTKTKENKLQIDKERYKIYDLTGEFIILKMKTCGVIYATQLFTNNGNIIQQV